MGDHAITHRVPRLKKVVDGEQGCITEDVNWQGGGGFHFYKLGESIFDEEGKITSGPDGKDLERFAISVNDKGRLLVDTSRSFPSPRWDDKESFVPIR